MENKDDRVIAVVTRNDGTEQNIMVFQNSSDFPSTHPLVMTSNWSKDGKTFYDTERVPITEEIWREIGKRLGFKFVVRKKKVTGEEQAEPKNEKVVGDEKT